MLRLISSNRIPLNNCSKETNETAISSWSRINNRSWTPIVANKNKRRINKSTKPSISLYINISLRNKSLNRKSSCLTSYKRYLFNWTNSNHNYKEKNLKLLRVKCSRFKSSLFRFKRRYKSWYKITRITSNKSLHFSSRFSKEKPILSNHNSQSRIKIKKQMLSKFNSNRMSVSRLSSNNSSNFLCNCSSNRLCKIRTMKQKWMEMQLHSRITKSKYLIYHPKPSLNFRHLIQNAQAA